MLCKGGEVLMKKLHGCLGKSSSEDLREFLLSKLLFIPDEDPMISSSRILSSVESSSRLSSGLGDSSSSSSSSSLTSMIPKTKKKFTMLVLSKVRYLDFDRIFTY